MKNILLTIMAVLSVLTLNGCTDAEIASSNLSKAADNFELERRVVFYNGITGEYMLTIQGRCSVSPSKAQLAVTCKVGSDEYKKHYLGLSDNVTYFSEQIYSANVSAYHYRVMFKPQTIMPDVDFKGDLSSAGKALTPDTKDQY